MAAVEKHSRHFIMADKEGEEKDTLGDYVKENNKTKEDKKVAKVLDGIKAHDAVSSDSVGETKKEKKEAKKESKIDKSAKKIVKIAKEMDPEDKYMGDKADAYDSEFELESKKDQTMAYDAQENADKQTELDGEALSKEIGGKALAGEIASSVGGAGFNEGLGNSNK